MNTFLKLVALFLALLGCPLRAEIVTDKKVFTPSPTSTLQTLVEEAYGNKVKVRCPKAVHSNLKTLIYVPMGLVLKVDAARYTVSVEEAYPAKNVDELDAKIAARLAGKKKVKEVAVKPDRAPTPDPTAKPKTVPSDPQTSDSKTVEPPTAHITEDGITFLDHASVARSFDLKTVQTAMKEAADIILGLKQNQQSVAVVGKQRDEAMATNAKLAEEVKTLTRERDEAKASLEPEQSKVKAEQALTKAAMIERDQTLAQLATASAEKEKALREQKKAFDQTLSMRVLCEIGAGVGIALLFFLLGRLRRKPKVSQVNLGDLSPARLMRVAERDDVKHQLTGTRVEDPDRWPNGKILDPRVAPEPPLKEGHPESVASDSPRPPEKPVRSIPIPRDGPPSPKALKTVPEPLPKKAEVTVIPLPASEPSSAGHDDDTVVLPLVSSSAPPVPENPVAT